MLQGVVDGSVLFQHGGACGVLSKHHLTIVEYALAHQIEHGAHHVQHDDIVAGFDDGGMKQRVQPGLFVRIVAGMGHGHLVEYRLDHHQVTVGGMQGRALGGKRLHIAAERYIVEHGLVMRGEQPRQGRRKRRPQNIGDEYAGPGAGKQQPLLLQIGDRATQRRPRYAQSLGQFTLGRQPLARAKNPAQDQQFDLTDDRCRNLFGLNFLKRHGIS